MTRTYKKVGFLAKNLILPNALPVLHAAKMSVENTLYISDVQIKTVVIRSVCTTYMQNIGTILLAPCMLNQNLKSV